MNQPASVTPLTAHGLASVEVHMAQALAEAVHALAQGEFPVGCVLVSQGQVVARGRRRHSGGVAVNELDHAEIIALRDLLTNNPDVPPAEVTAYTTLEPCLMCYAALMISGVRNIVYAYEDVLGGGVCLPRGRMPPLYRNLRLTIVHKVMREESLRLFREFFSRPEGVYLKDSLLARHVLAQP
ncbi:MAG: nucleoside deaminase [Desulfobacteraceae bacterium]|nr:nucleoside deaminase [Desulfobacteraceae bacterium]